MKAAVLVFPGSNCDRDLAVAFRNAGFDVDMVWHKDTELPAGTDIVGVPGGFSFGDYLRCGAIAARSPITSALKSHVEKGGYAIGICNGFQVLLETGLLPGALMRNSGLKFICKPVELEVATVKSDFTAGYDAGQVVTFPVAHHDGNYQATEEIRKELLDEDRVAFRYARELNGSVDRIAGILSKNRRVLGLMPHPERAADPALGRSDGTALFNALAGAALDA
ncbi:phosphoribosylformylglycinamidine synthase subunit PurQ [Silicimonas sp. MF1-12-2]|uniref:phosphoribosylformylglycinamidine synthase subunit PurQ n=1 Tax=Silicimonas sp. MF1-12-2 TaxID=3384793 RepID=UPI0039B56185